MRNGLWTKGLVFGMIMLFVGTSTLQNISGELVDSKSDINKKLDQIDQSMTTITGFGGMPYGVYWAQSFTPSLPVLTRVQLFISSDFTGNIIFSIRDDLDGGDLILISTRPDHGGWFEFDFPDIPVTPGEKYYIVLTKEINDMVLITFGASLEEDLYLYGEMYYGVPWSPSPHTTYDLAFITYGSGGGNQPVIEIDQMNGGFGVSVVIKNNGTAAATDVSWLIDISGGWIILSGDHTEGTIDELAVGASTTIKAKPRGIGRITIIVQADDAVKEATAFLLGPLVLRVTEL